MMHGTVVQNQENWFLSFGYQYLEKLNKHFGINVFSVAINFISPRGLMVEIKLTL